jgi:hypothetical protein
VDAGLVDRGHVPAAERSADGLVEDGLAADALDHDRGRHLALAEAGHLEVAAERAGGLLDAAGDLVGAHLGFDAHARLGELGDGGLDGLCGSHWSASRYRRAVPRPSLAHRLQAWLILGPPGHLYGGVADWATLLARYLWARARGRDPETLT